MVFDNLAQILLGISGLQQQRAKVQSLDGTLKDAKEQEDPAAGGRTANDRAEQILEEEFGDSNLFGVDVLLQSGFGGIVEASEDFVTGPVREEGELTPENVGLAVDRAEGGALGLTALAIVGNLAVELAGGTQMESHQFVTSQFLGALALEDIVGAELSMLFSKGVEPALEARVGKQTRSEFVSLPDAVEYALRNKTNDDEYLTISGAPPEVVDEVGSNNQVSAENLLEEWGIRDDQLDILEEVSLEQIEFEELLETPAELGLIVPDDVLEAELDRMGYAEPTKEFLQETAQALPRSARTYQELLITEELIGQLDTLAEDGVLAPGEAVAQVPDEIDADPEAFRERFERLQETSAGAPSGSDIEGAFASGFIDRERFEELLGQQEYDVERFPEVLQKTILDELDGDLRTAVGLGLLDRGEYTSLADEVGLDQQAIEQLLAGADLDDIALERLQQRIPPSERPVTDIGGIGDATADSLRLSGIEAIGDLASASPEALADERNFSLQQAQQLVGIAQQISE